MRRTLSRFRARYGSDPLHLLTLLCCLALAGYAAALTTADSRWPLMLVWFVAALIGHDLILFPLYALADRSLKAAAHAVRRPRPRAATSVSPLNYLRVPAFGSALTFLLYLPGIIRHGGGTYLAATGQTQQPFLARWLLLCAAMFGVSAVAYAVRVGREARTQRPR